MDTTFCVNWDFMLQGPAGYNGYAWSTGDTTQNVFFPANTLPIGFQSFDLTVTNEWGCTATDQVMINVWACAGMDEGDPNENILVFPNPTDGNLSIEHNLSGEVLFQLFDVTGKLVLQKTSANPVISIDFTNQAKGIYHLQLINNQKINNIKIIKN